MAEVKLEEAWVPQTFAQRMFMTLEDPGFSKLAKNISNFVMSLIVMGCFTFVMESVEDFQTMKKECQQLVLPEKFKDPDVDCAPGGLRIFAEYEAYCIYIFTVEYLCRIFTVSSVPESVWNIKEEGLEQEDDDGTVSERPPKGALALTYGYATSFMNCIDIVAIVPFYIEKFFGAGAGLGVIRVMRLTRVLRVLKSPKFAEAVKLFSLSLEASMPALSILFFFSALAIILFGSLVYFFEAGTWVVDDSVCCPFATNSSIDDGGHMLGNEIEDSSVVEYVCQLGCFTRPSYLAGADDRPREISPFTSIPTSFYWVITTMTTVGFGDLYPTTGIGRFLSMWVMYGGIFGLALPITVIGANFSRQYELLNAERERKAELESALEKTNSKAAIVSSLERARTSIIESRGKGDGGGAHAGVAASSAAAAADKADGSSVKPTSRLTQTVVSDVTDEDEAAARNGKVDDIGPLMKPILSALPRVETAVAAHVATAQQLQALMQKVRSTVDRVQAKP